MKNHFRILYFLPLWSLLLTQHVFGQSASLARAEKIEFSGYTWTIAAQDVSRTTHLGRESLIVSGGRVWIDGSDFKDGVIEFDVAYDETPGFIGAMWRGAEARQFEEFYIRAHHGNEYDSLQYTPVENTVSAWQIFSDVTSLKGVPQYYTIWNHVKIVVKGNSANIFYNSDEDPLYIPDLKTNRKRGEVGLRVTGRQKPIVYFSNFSIRPFNADDKLIETSVKESTVAAGLIHQWEVSSRFDETKIKSALVISDLAQQKLTWTTLDTEANGIANLAKLNEPLNDANTVFVKTIVKADHDDIKELRFGYSDRVRLYLNGVLIYSGEAGWRTRDPRFLGIVGFNDSVGLKLNLGENELIAAVSETFGGWAWGAKIAP